MGWGGMVVVMSILSHVWPIIWDSEDHRYTVVRVLN